MLAGIISGLVWFSVFLAGHIALFHFRWVQNRFKVIARLFLAALLGHMLTVGGISVLETDMGPAFHGGFLTALVCGCLVECCLFVLYMPFYYTIATSISVQTIIHIETAAGKRRLSDLRDVFASKNVLRDRLASMVANGYLIRAGEKYQVTPKGRFVGRVFALIKSTWRLGAGG